jgi:hypothetical protein
MRKLEKVRSFIILTFHRDQIKEDELGRIYNTHGREEFIKN